MTYIDRPAGLDAPLWTPMARNPKMHRFWEWGECTNPCNYTLCPLPPRLPALCGVPALTPPLSAGVRVTRQAAPPALASKMRAVLAALSTCM